MTTSLSTYDFSTLYTAFPSNNYLIKEKLLDLTEQSLKRVETLNLARKDKKECFLINIQTNGINIGLVRMYVTLYRIY